jgi:predicted MFS family arabinose efflux permease
MFPGLYLLGLGWSFAMVASSALLTESVGGDDAVSAQGTADLLSSVAAGVAALASGLVFTMAGFHILSAVGIVVSGLLMVVAWVHGRMSGRPQAAVVG